MPAALCALGLALLSPSPASAGTPPPSVQDSDAPQRHAHPQQERGPLVARVSARIARLDGQEAAWGAFEARTLALGECVPALGARLLATPVDADDHGLTRALQSGLLDALVELDAKVAVEDARAFHERGPWPTLLMIARHPEGHAPFLRELVRETAGERAIPPWLAPRLLLVDAKDSAYAADLLRSRTPRLQLRVLDPPAPGPSTRVFRCAGVRRKPNAFSSTKSVWVPDGFPPTARWTPLRRASPGSMLLAGSGRRSLYLDRTLMQPGSGGGSGSGGTMSSNEDHERDFLLDLSVGPASVELALKDWSRTVRWSGQEEMQKILAEGQADFEEARATLVRRVCKHTGLDAEEVEDVLRPVRAVIDERTDRSTRLELPEGWTLEKNPQTRR